MEQRAVLCRSEDRANNRSTRQWDDVLFVMSWLTGRLLSGSVCRQRCPALVFKTLKGRVQHWGCICTCSAPSRR